MSGPLETGHGSLEAAGKELTATVPSPGVGQEWPYGLREAALQSC